MLQNHISLFAFLVSLNCPQTKTLLERCCPIRYSRAATTTFVEDDQEKINTCQPFNQRYGRWRPCIHGFVTKLGRNDDRILDEAI